MPRSLTSMGFVLMLVLMGLVFYVGLSTNFATFAQGARMIIYALTGRDNQGRTISYAAGAPAGVQYAPGFG